jgi:hypothetical protein
MLGMLPLVTVGSLMTLTFGITVCFISHYVMVHFVRMTFNELWFLVDGIYPSLSHFFEPLSVPLDDPEAIFSM